MMSPISFNSIEFKINKRYHFCPSCGLPWKQPLQVEPVAATDDEEPAPAAAPEAVEEPAPADAQPTDVDEAALDDTTNGTSPFRLRGLPWYIKSDGYRPLAGEPLAGRVWPDESNGRRLIDDRIEAQLMIAPPKLPADVDDSDAPLKKIFLPNGLGSWQVKGGRGLFLEQKCPVDRCVLTSRRNDAATADAIMYKGNISCIVLLAVRTIAFDSSHELWLLLRLNKIKIKSLCLHCF